MTVSRSQLFDWVIVAVVIIATYWLEVSNLFFCQPYSADDPTISYPLVPNTIRSSMLVLLVMAPMCLVLVIHILGWTSTYELHNTILGYTQSIVTANAITTALKLYVGRLRPDFLDRLRQAGYTKVQIENWAAMCYVYDDVVVEGRKSFPSGASCIVFASMTFLFFYVCGKWRVFQRGQLVPMLFALVPIIFALFVCASRLRDFWHHGSDVVAGCSIGLFSAYFCYQINFEARDNTGEMAPRNAMGDGYEDVTYFTSH